ncbi:MAG: hypothetical protein IPF54_26385 [Draconibacterium sp.]|nr:hypothetical protein [Draconibacterium sp.]
MEFFVHIELACGFFVCSSQIKAFFSAANRAISSGGTVDMYQKREYNICRR